MNILEIENLEAADLFRFYDINDDFARWPTGDLKFKRQYMPGKIVVTNVYYPDGQIAIKSKHYKKHAKFGKFYITETWYESGKKQLQCTGVRREYADWYLLYHENGQRKELNAYNKFIRRWDDQGHTIECKYCPNEKWIDFLEICRQKSVPFAKLEETLNTIIRDLRARNFMSPYDYDFSFNERQKAYHYFASAKQK